MKSRTEVFNEIKGLLKNEPGALRSYKLNELRNMDDVNFFAEAQFEYKVSLIPELKVA